MSTDAEIRTTLRQTADGAEAPPIDDVAFGRRVRRHRLRRRAGLTAATAAVAAAVLAVPVAVNQIGSDAGPSQPPVAAGSEHPNPPAYFLAGQQVMTLDPQGRAHALGVFRAESVVGPTAEGVLLVGRDSRLLHVAVTRDGDEWTAERIPAPTTNPVQSAAVSADGTRVAVGDRGEDVVVYDLASGDELTRKPNDRSAYVADFSDRVLYAVGDDSLRLGMGPGGVEIPVFDGPAWLSFVGANTIAVTSQESNVTTRVYDVATGSAEEIAELSGWWGDVSPDGRYFFGAQDEGSRELLDLETGESYPVTGLEGSADQLQWLDQDTALVASAVGGDGGQVSGLYACEASTLGCREVYESERLIWLDS